ncbi:MAG: hypothetical protein ACREV7_00550 [Steroidobacteraceae bacterium]
MIVATDGSLAGWRPCGALCARHGKASAQARLIGLEPELGTLRAEQTPKPSLKGN